MSTNPGITADLATQHRMTARRVIASLAAAAAAAVLMTSPVGSAHLASNYAAGVGHYENGVGHYESGVGHYE